MRTLLNGAVTLGFFACIAIAGEQAGQPQASLPRMELANVGPRTEMIDPKAYALILHIAPTGSDQAAGTETAPLATITGALAKISDAGEHNRCAIFVAAGEYRQTTIEMKLFVDLFGRFDVKTWERDIFANQSVLDGKGQSRVVMGGDNARIDGFVIRNGKVRGPGAGILCDRASPTISNNTILFNATLAPKDVAERKMIHQRGHEGGAVACLNGSASTITNNVIAQNTTEIGNGGGIGVFYANGPQITNNLICGNHSGIGDIDRLRSSNGGGISASHAQGRMTIVNNVIVNNRINGDSDGGGIYLEYDSSPLVAANWVLGNLAEDDGGAMYIMKGSQPTVIGNIFAGSKGSSGITLSKEGRGIFENNFIYGNPCGLSCYESWMQLTHNTIVANHGPGVIYRQPPHMKPAVVTENIIYGNAGLAQVAGGAEFPLVVTHNDIEGGHVGAGNFDEPLSFGNDRLMGTASSIKFDPRRFQTTLTTAEISSGEHVVGRVLTIGGKWGVVKSFSGGAMVVWGDLRAPNPETRFEIPMSYVLRGPAPEGVGAAWEKL